MSTVPAPKLAQVQGHMISIEGVPTFGGTS
jgi:hypothetical protein